MRQIRMFNLGRTKNESQSYNLYATIKYKMIIQVPRESLDASMTVTFMNTSIDRWTDLFYPDLQYTLHIGYQY